MTIAQISSRCTTFPGMAFSVLLDVSPDAPWGHADARTARNGTFRAQWRARIAHREGHIYPHEGHITQGASGMCFAPQDCPRARKNVTHVVTILCVQGAPLAPLSLPRHARFSVIPRSYVPILWNIILVSLSFAEYYSMECIIMQNIILKCIKSA